MKTIKRIFLPSLSASIILLLAACGGLENILNDPIIFTETTQLIWMTPERIQLQSRVKLENPNPVTLNFQQTLCNLTINGKKIASRVSPPTRPIHGYETVILPFDFQIDRSELETVIGQNTNLELQTSGYLYPDSKWNKAHYSFFRTQNFVMPRLPLIARMKNRISPDRQKRFLVFKITNPNIVPIQAQSLHGQVHVKTKNFKFLPLSRAKAIAPEKSLLLLVSTAMPADRSMTGAYISGEIEFLLPEGKIILPIPNAIEP